MALRPDRRALGLLALQPSFDLEAAHACINELGDVVLRSLVSDEWGTGAPDP